MKIIKAFIKDFNSDQKNNKNESTTLHMNDISC